MRILHTSDWHLGKTLSGFSRAAEHEAFLDELVDLAAGVDLVLVTGDVFDTYNPPIEAEELLYDALARLGDGGRRAVVVIAGNHDSPDRLAAPAPLAARHGVFVLGRPGDVAPVSRFAASGRVRAQAGPSLLKLDLPRGERAVVAALPYPSESRLRTLLSASLAEGRRQAAYEARVAAAFRHLAGSFEPGAVNVAASHLSVARARISESERTLVGGATTIGPEALPGAAQYVALGHLHYPQAVEGAPTLARYAGAPLAFRMSERDYPRSHCIVEVSPGGEARVELVPVAAGRPLVRWEAAGGVEEVVRGCERGLHAGAFVELAVHVPEPLDHTQLALLRSLDRDFVRIRAVLPEARQEEAPPPEIRRAVPADELFRAFYREQSGDEPDEAVVQLFLELAEAAAAEPLHDEPESEGREPDPPRRPVHADCAAGVH